MKFGENLKKLRKSKKLSQEDLAEKVNVSRQSVSKWETGDAYPEMNNVLELCKIFHCHINELVNDSILDIDSLDEDVKMSTVKFKKEKQEKVKNLSKAISILSKIGQILVCICIPLILIAIIASPFIISNIKVEDNVISFKGYEEIIIVEDNEKVTLKLKDNISTDKDTEKILKLKEVLENNSKFNIIGYVEIGFIILEINLILIFILFKNLKELFNNIHNGDTPFTLENVHHIKKMAYLLIAIILLPNIGGVVFELILDSELDIGFELINIVEILFLFSMSYIFEYGYELQLDSKGIMYGEEDE